MRVRESPITSAGTRLHASAVVPAERAALLSARHNGGRALALRATGVDWPASTSSVVGTRL